MHEYTRASFMFHTMRIKKYYVEMDYPQKTVSVLRIGKTMMTFTDGGDVYALDEDTSQFVHRTSLTLDDSAQLCEVANVFLVKDRLVVVSKDYVSTFRASDFSFVSKCDFSADQLLDSVLGDHNIEIKDTLINVLDYPKLKCKVAIFSTKILLLSDTNELVN